MLHLNDRCVYSFLWITPDLRCKNVFGFCVCLRRQSKSEEAALSLHLSEPLRKQKVVVRDL